MTFLTSILLSLTVLSADQPVETPGRKIAITVQIKSQKPITFTVEELGKLEHTKVEINAGEDQQTYEGVCVAAILQAAGVKWGTTPSPWLDCYVLVEAADGYRAVFSIPEIDLGSAHMAVLLADRRNGKALSKTEGPYQIIEEDARHRGRWVRQVIAIHVRTASE